MSKSATDLSAEQVAEIRRAVVDEDIRALCDSHESLRSALSAAQHDSEEVAWVVVGGRPGLEYLTGEITPRWSGNHADAIRFARKQDAERMIELMREILRSHGLVLPHDIRAEEHIWDAARSAVSPSPEPDK